MSLTVDRRLGPGPVVRRGGLAPYRSLTYAEGETHLVRDDLVEAPGRRPAVGRPLLCLVHVTDLQLADVQSPARFEFLNAYYADPRYAEIIPVQRPQEVLTPHAVDTTVRTINALTGPVSGLAPDLVVSTGDAIDNAQWNEVQALLALFDGGEVRFGPPGQAGTYFGVQSPGWPGDVYWRPDGDADGGPDIFRREFGFPRHPGLLDRALREFRATGLMMGWLACYGNHEALNQGVGTQTAGLLAALTGDRKPTALPDGFDHDQALELFTTKPETFMTGPVLPVAADPGRRPVSRAEFVASHFGPGARPAGHGFTDRNRREGTAYYVHDTPAVRLIALDTACLAGGADGCLDADQARWLEASLAEVHSSYLGRDGEPVATANADRLVVIFSHHGFDMLTNTRCAGSTSPPVLRREELLALLHRFGNVVLWLNGHTHTNSVRPRPDPTRPGRGFWEVTTCAVVDWPCQTRLVELIDSDGELSIVCTMVDHDSPTASSALVTSDDLASLHRELAANMPLGGADSGLAGTPRDRNVWLRIRAPFPLSRLPA